MRILNSVAHSDGVWVEAVVDTAADLASLETYAAEFFKGAPYIVEGSIVLATREGAFYVKDSSGEWVKQGEDSGNSNTANLTSSGVSTASLEKVGKFNGETLASTQNAPDALSGALQEQEQEETSENDGDEVSEDAVGDTESE